MNATFTASPARRASRQLLAQLEDLHQELGRRRDLRGPLLVAAEVALLAADVDARALEQVLGPPHRILERPLGLVELDGARQRRAPRARSAVAKRSGCSCRDSSL